MLGRPASLPYRAIWLGAPAAIVLLDEDGRILDANPAAERVLAPLDDLQNGSDFARLFVDTRVQAWVGDVVAGEREASVAIEAMLRDGRTVEVRGTNHLRDPELRAVLLGVADVSAKARAIRDLEARALYDALTGLPNRALFEDRLRQARRTAPVSAVIMIDLDRFKSVNDRHGHGAGDEVLKATAGRIARSVRPAATVTRFGGDEFVVLLPGDGEPEAAAVAARLVEVIREPIALQQGGTVIVTGSAGVATTDGAFRADTVLRRADLAMYRAKTDGGDRRVVFAAEMSEWGPAGERTETAVAELLQRNAELERLVRTDEITGIENVRSYREHVTAIHAEAVRTGRPYSLVFCDIDRFGLLNKHHGQQAGDSVLRTVAATLVECSRTGDEVYRRGGEEIVVILPDTPRGAALEAAERLRRAVEDLAIENGAEAAQPIVTISAGVATLDPERHRSHEDVEADADRAMFAAKREGRNRVLPAAG